MPLQLMDLALSFNFNGQLVQYRYTPPALTTGNEMTLTSATATTTYCYQGRGPILYLGEMSDFLLQKKTSFESLEIRLTVSRPPSLSVQVH